MAQEERLQGQDEARHATHGEQEAAHGERGPFVGLRREQPEPARDAEQAFEHQAAQFRQPVAAGLDGAGLDVPQQHEEGGDAHDAEGKQADHEHIVDLEHELRQFTDGRGRLQIDAADERHQGEQTQADRFGETGQPQGPGEVSTQAGDTPVRPPPGRCRPFSGRG